MGLDHQSTQKGLRGDGGSCRCETSFLPDDDKNNHHRLGSETKLEKLPSNLKCGLSKLQKICTLRSCTQFACSPIWICYLWPTQTDTLGRQVHFWQFLDRNLIGIFLSLVSGLSKAVAITDLHSHSIIALLWDLCLAMRFLEWNTSKLKYTKLCIHHCRLAKTKKFVQKIILGCNPY